MDYLWPAWRNDDEDNAYVSTLALYKKTKSFVIFTKIEKNSLYSIQ